jgi:hypothetical protein
MNILKIFNHEYVDEVTEESKTGFFVIYCEDFSQNIYAQHVQDNPKYFEIERNIEPNTMRVLDLKIIEGNAWIAMLQDQKFIVDTFNYEEKEKKHQEVKQTEWQIDLSEGFSSCWPYFTYRGLTNFGEGGYQAGAKNFQILFNAANRNELIRIAMPGDSFSHPYSYITETNELYIICEFEDRYEMYQVYLDEYEDMKNKKNNIYHMEKRLILSRDDYEDLQAFHVRGGDLKYHDGLDANNKSIAFFIFNNKLYYWMYGMEDGVLKPVTLKDDEEIIEVDQTQFDVIDDSNIVISQRVDSKGKPLYKIHQIAIDISIFEVQTIYETDELLYEVINYGFDEKDKVIIFLKKDKSKNKSKPKYFVTIVDILDDDQIKVLFNEKIT